MSEQECPVNCKDNPDAVDKINWKCVECHRDLKADFDRVINERAAAAEAKQAEAIAAAPKQLSEEDVKNRRDMANEPESK